MLRAATWKSWAVPAVLFAVFLVLGATWNPPGHILDWIFKIGTLGATLGPPAGITAWTLSGRHWWRNDVGTALVQSLLSIVVIVAPLAWAAWVDHGSITGGMVAWVEVAGPLLVTITVGNLFWVLLRASGEETRPAA